MLVGNFGAKRIFDRNRHFRARLGLPLVLPARYMEAGLKTRSPSGTLYLDSTARTSGTRLLGGGRAYAQLAIWHCRVADAAEAYGRFYVCYDYDLLGAMTAATKSGTTVLATYG